MVDKVRWKNLKTKNGYAADEVISALQKDIRRGNIDASVWWAYCLFISGDKFISKLWERLLTISVEDIGLANPLANTIVLNAKNSSLLPYDHEGDIILFALFAAAYLAESPKNRYIDEVKNVYKTKKNYLQIPDYALDKHTTRGKKLKRDDEHFWTIAAKLDPEQKDRNKTFLNIILSELK